MIQISFQSERFVPADRLGYLHARRAARRAQLAEAKACTTLPELCDWKAESRAAVDELEAKVKQDDTTIAAAEKAAAALDTAVAAEAQAVEALGAAEAAHAAGTLDEAEAMRLFASVEACKARLRVFSPQRVAAAGLLASLLPQRPDVPELHGREVVEAVARLASAKHNRPDGYVPIRAEVWERFLESSEVELRFMPMWLKFELAKAEATRAGSKIRTPNGDIVDWRRADETTPAAVLLSEMKRFRAEREVHLRTKAEKARRDLEAAQGRVAEMGGAR